MRRVVYLIALLLQGLTVGQEELPGKVSLAEQASLARRIVEKLRGGPFLRIPSLGKCDTKVIDEHLRLLRNRHMTPEWEVAHDKAYRVLGLYHGEEMYGDALLRIQATRSGGFHLPGGRTLFVRPQRCGNTLGLAFLAGLMARIWDEQYFGIPGFLPAGDSLFAQVSLRSGSAKTCEVRTIFQLRNLGNISQKQLMEAQVREQKEGFALLREPATLVARFYAPRVLGVTFLARGHLQSVLAGNDGRLAKAYHDPPRSSEQILHPEKYWDPEHRDNPVQVILPGGKELAGKGWRISGSGTLGEIQCALLARPEDFSYSALRKKNLTSSALWTNAAAMGWAGDRYALYRKQKQSILAWCAAWDTVADAQVFFRAFYQHRKHRLGAVERKGRVLYFLFGLPLEQAQKLTTRLAATSSFRSTANWPVGGSQKH